MEQPFSLTVNTNYTVPSCVKNINVDTTRGAVTITLPSMINFFADNIKASQNSFEIWIFDYAGTAATHNITVQSSAGDFFVTDADGVVTSLVISSGYGGMKLVAQGGTNNGNSGGKWGKIAIS